MKKLNLKKLVLSLAFLSMFSAFSQNIVSTQNTSGDGFCDGMAILNYTPNPGSWYWQNNNGQILQQGGDTLAGLCYGNYLLVMNDSSSTNTYTFFIDSTNNTNPCSNYNFILSSSTNVSGSNLCDGSASINMNGNTFQTYNTSQLGVNVTQANGFVYINGICDGLFHITFANNSCSSSVTCDVSYIDSTNTGGCNSLVTTNTTTNTTTDITCDGSISLASSGGTAPYSYQYSANGISITNTTGQILDLCAGNYTIVTFDANGCSSSTQVYVGSDSTNTGCNGFYAYVTDTQDPSNPFACDGSITIEAVGGTAPYSYNVANGTTGTSSVIENLCEGNYVIIVQDNIGCSYTLTAVLGSNDTTNTSGVYGIVSTYNVSETGACDGIAFVSMQAGTAPFVYSNSTGNSNTTGVFDNLCEGIYTVVVTDANGISTSISYLISGPTNSSNGGNPNGNTAVIDSLYSGLLENCDIDYASVDTVIIDSYTVYGQDSIVVVWAVYQTNDTLYITETYNITNGAGVYQVVLTVYCPGRIEGNYWYASAYVNTSSLSVDDIEHVNEPEISQILGQDAILVNLPQSASFDWEIVDMTGRIIQKGSQEIAEKHIIQLTSVSQGHYVFKLIQESKLFTKTVIR